MTPGFIITAIAVVGLLAMLFLAMWQSWGKHTHKWVLAFYSETGDDLYECAYPHCDETRTAAHLS